MAIDDPLATARTQIQAEERSDVLDLPRQLASGIAGLLPGVLSDILKSALQRDEAERSRYLFGVLEREFIYVRENMRALQQRAEAERQFIEGEFPSLLPPRVPKSCRNPGPIANSED